MKSFKFLLCAALAAGLSNLDARLDAAVESPVVGYTTKTTKTGQNLVASTFVGLTGVTYDIQDFVTGDFQEGDTLTFRNEAGTGYDQPYTYSLKPFAIEDGKLVEKDTPGWTNYLGILATRAIEPGTPVWLKTKAETLVTFAGEVSTTDQSVACKQGVTLLAPSSPSPIYLNGSDFVVEGAREDDSIMVWNITTKMYDEYYYYDVLYEVVDGELTEAGSGWGNRLGFKVTTPIPAGSAFWINAKTGPVTLKVASPL